MKNYVKLILPILVGAVVLTSCNKVDPPTADFIYEIDVLTVTFENLSSDADSYSWDFGDGNASTEMSPVHTYTDGGTFTVSLKATNEGGSDTFTDEFTLTKPGAIIDGSFDDWDEYNAIYSDPDAVNGTIKEFKMASDAAFIYFYLKLTSDRGPAIQVYFDKDNDNTTGWSFWDGYDCGLEYLLEYVVEDFEGVWGPATVGATVFEATEEDWPWTIEKATDAVAETSGYVSSGSDVEIEFSMARSIMTDLASTIAVSVFNSDQDWEQAGALPLIWQDPPLPLNTFTFSD